MSNTQLAIDALRLLEVLEKENAALRDQLKEAQNWGEPVAIVSNIHSSRYTLEWYGRDYPEGTKLYAKKEEGK